MNANNLPPAGRRDPDARGYFGAYGGRFVPETLVAPVEELTEAYFEARADVGFRDQFSRLLRDYVGRPTPLFEAVRLTEAAGGARLFLKREDLAHTGAHKINNALGQALLARRMGKRRVVAETGAGQHGVATAAACALVGLDCEVYMGADDMVRQQPNVTRMRLLGAVVRRVDAGSRTLKDAISEAMRDWAASLRDTHYLLGSVLGPHPYPLMVREFQAVIGREAREQCLAATGRLPDLAVASVGGAATPWASSTPSSTIVTSGCWASKEAATGGSAATTPRDSRRGRPASSTAHAPSSSRTRPETSTRPTRSRPASTTPPSDPSTRGCARRDAPSTSRRPTTRRWRPSDRSRDSKEFFRRSNPRTPWPSRCAGRASSGRTAPSS